MNVDVRLSKSNLKESVSKDVTPTQLAKLLPILLDTVQNAVGVESHDNRYFYDSTTVFFENLLGGYYDGEYFVPVRFGLKHSITGEATLYVIVDQNKIERQKIKAEVTKAPGVHKARSETSRSAYVISIADIISFVNSKDLLRYLPDDMLDGQQRKAKWEAVADTIIKTDRKNDKKYSEFIASGNLKAAQNMVNAAADTAGYRTNGYHGSRTPGFTVVDKYSWLWLARSEDVATGYGTRDAVDNNKKPHDAHGVYTMRYNLGKNLAVYADGASWGELPVTEDEYPGVFVDEETGAITTNSMAEWAARNGYDSITFEDVDDGGLTTVDVVFNPNRDAKSADPITYDDKGNVIPISMRFNPENDDIRYQARPSEETSNRYLLANALESAAQTDAERQKLQQYREQIKNAENLEERLDKINRRIFEESFAPGPRDTAKLNEMRETANRMARQYTYFNNRRRYYGLTTLIGLPARKASILLTVMS